MQQSVYVPPHLRGGAQSYGGNPSSNMNLRGGKHGGYQSSYHPQPYQDVQNHSYLSNGAFRNNYQRDDHRQYGSGFHHRGGRGGYGSTYGSRFNTVQDESDVLKLFDTTGVSKGINFAGYDNIPVTMQPEGSITPIAAFADVNLPEEVLANLERCKYDSPTPVQKYTIPAALQGKGLMACAQTGSGKTAAFLLPVVAKLVGEAADTSSLTGTPGAVFVRCVIMAPTRELAIQIHIEARKFCYRTGLRAVVLYGGADIRAQLNDLNLGGDLVIATPGRLWDVYQRGRIRFCGVKHLILDEADRMLDMGFEPQIRQIVQSRESDMPPRENRQTMMFSATFPKEIQALAQEFLTRDFTHLTIGRIGSTTQNIVQTLWHVDENDKMDALIEALRNQQGRNLTLVFAETRRGVEGITRRLIKSGFQAVSIHGDKAQSERENALNAFRTGQKPILVATDVASRGLDIPNVMCIVQFDLPHHIDEYVHRIGRTGRCGNEGEAIGFFATKNVNLAKDLYEVFTEANQEVPEFLQNAVTAISYQHQKQSNRFSGRGGNRNGGNNNAGNNPFSRGVPQRGNVNFNRGHMSANVSNYHPNAYNPSGMVGMPPHNANVPMHNMGRNPQGPTSGNTSAGGMYNGNMSHYNAGGVNNANAYAPPSYNSGQNYPTDMNDYGNQDNRGAFFY